MFKQVKIILINTTHPGNIGATARAIKNMGFEHLCLVSPQKFPSPEAIARASGAEDILEHAEVVESLTQALKDCHWILGLSARIRKIPMPLLSPREAAREAVHRLSASASYKVALVFGREQSGLLNEEVDKCQGQILIPTNPSFPSLNLAQAVQVLTYEFRMAFLESGQKGSNNDNKDLEQAFVGGQEMENFYKHLEDCLVAIKFLDRERPGHLLSHLRRLYSRTHLTRLELNIMRGILTTMQKSV